MDNQNRSHSTIDDFLDGLADRARSEGEAPTHTGLTDRQLAAIAWPEAEDWDALSPGDCEEAIERQLSDTEPQ